MVRLARERQRDETQQVDDEDEEEERGDVRKPAADRLRRQPLLGDLRLRNLVDLLADRLPNPRLSADRHAHQDDSEQDRQDGREHQVGNRLRDREVQWAEVDGNPLVLLELLDGIELAARERRLRERECKERDGKQARSHRLPPKYATMERPSSNVYASA